MKTAKRLLCLLLCAVMVLSLFAACSGQSEKVQPTPSTSEVSTSPTTVPETMVPETTAAPTEPPMAHLAPDELEKRINQELFSQSVPYIMEIVYGHSCDDIWGIVHPTDESDDISKDLQIRMNFDINTNRITRIDLFYTPYANVAPKPLMQEQQTLVVKLCACISKAFDPMFSEESLETMIHALPSEPATEEINKVITNEISLYHGIYTAAATYQNTAGMAVHSIGNCFDNSVLTGMSYYVSSEVEQFYQTVPANTDLSTCVTVRELETLLNEKFTQLGLPLVLTFEKDYERGSFYSSASYTGEYADVETNKLIFHFENIFNICIDATGISKDSFIRSIEYLMNIYALNELIAIAPQYIDPLTDVFTELAFIIACALDDQISNDMLEQLSSITPFDTSEYTYDGITYTQNYRSHRFSSLFCKKLEHGQSCLTYPSIVYTFDVIGLLSDEFNPYIPHGAEVNEPQYLEHEFKFVLESIDDEYIKHVDEYSAKEAIAYDVNEFLDGTYSPVRVELEYTPSAYYAFVFEDINTGLFGKLDENHYIMYQFSDNTVNVVYNTDYTNYFPEEFLSAGIDPEYVLRVPIGISLMYDVEMTPEEAHQLFNGKMEPTDTYQDYQVTVYCPRDMMHILLKNPETEENQFWLLEKARFDALYGDMTSFLESIFQK